MNLAGSPSALCECVCVCVCVCVCARAYVCVSVRVRVCVCVHVSVCVCEKGERVWVYACGMVWACVDLAFKSPAILLSFKPELLLHSPKSEDLATSRLRLTLAL